MPLLLLMAAAGGNSPPTIAITIPTSSPTFSTATTPLTVGGTAAAGTGSLTSVTWTNSAGGSGTATGTTSWSASIPLQAGSNVITAVVHDSLGSQGSATLTVTLTGVTPPTIAITVPTGSPTFSTNTTPLTLSGTAAAGSGSLTNVTWTNSAGGSGTATGTTSWSQTGIVLTPGQNVLTATVHDSLGNTASATLTVTFTDVTVPTVAITAPTGSPTFATNAATLNLAGTAADNVAVASVTWTNSTGPSGNAAGTTSWTVTGVLLIPGANVLTVTAHDTSGNLGSAVLTVTFTDITNPTIAITAPTSSPTFTTALTAIAVSGTAADNDLVQSVTWANSAGGSGTATGTTNWSIPTVALAAGSNVITVTAHDRSGNTAAAVLTVTRQGTVNFPPADSVSPARTVTPLRTVSPVRT